ncbi:hypothetical protein [Moorena producens]
MAYWPRYGNTLGLLATLREQPNNLKPANLPTLAYWPRVREQP